MEFNNSVEIAVGIVLAVAALWLLNTLVEIPKYFAARREQREFLENIDRIAKRIMREHREMAHGEGAKNARTSSKTVKKASPSASKPQRKTGSSPRSSQKKVQTTKKGV